MRAVIVAAGVAFILSLLGTPIAIRVFTALKAGQPIRSLGPATHQGKKGTPTMGGVAFIAATVRGTDPELDRLHVDTRPGPDTLTVTGTTNQLIGFTFAQ